MIHELKTLQKYFDAVANGDKTFEVRKNDRDYHVGDFLALNEITEIEKKYTGRCCLLRITYILTAEEYVKPGYAILSVEPCAIMHPGQRFQIDKMPDDSRVPVYERRTGA